MQALFEVLCRSEDFGAKLLLPGLYSFVVGLDNRFLAGKIIVGRALGDVGTRGDVLHGRGIEAVFTKELQSTVEDVLPGQFAFGSRGLIFEHGQILLFARKGVKLNLNRVKKASGWEVLFTFIVILRVPLRVTTKNEQRPKQTTAQSWMSEQLYISPIFSPGH